MFVADKAIGEPQTAEQQNRKLKLSEAIRIGIPLVEHIPGDWRGCTLCTAAYGAGFVRGELMQNFVRNKFPVLSDCYPGSFPWGETTGLNLSTVVQALDGGWRGKPAWTREQIADWLESQGY